MKSAEQILRERAAATAERERRARREETKRVETAAASILGYLTDAVESGWREGMKAIEVRIDASGAMARMMDECPTLRPRIEALIAPHWKLVEVSENHIVGGTFLTLAPAQAPDGLMMPRSTLPVVSREPEPSPQGLPLVSSGSGAFASVMASGGWTGLIRRMFGR